MPEEIYNAVTGQVHVTQYANAKEKFIKEAYYKIRNLHPEVKLQSEKILNKLSRHYNTKIVGQSEEYKNLKHAIDARTQDLI